MNLLVMSRFVLFVLLLFCVRASAQVTVQENGASDSDPYAAPEIAYNVAHRPEQFSAFLNFFPQIIH